MPIPRQSTGRGTPLPSDVPPGACPVCALRGALALPKDTVGVALTEKPGDRTGRYKLRGMRPNEHSGVDAGRASLFEFWRPWPGATHRDR
jgi:hypothetical protein